LINKDHHDKTQAHKNALPVHHGAFIVMLWLSASLVFDSLNFRVTTENGLLPIPIPNLADSHSDASRSALSSSIILTLTLQSLVELVDIMKWIFAAG